MLSFNKKFEIEYNGKELFIREENSSGSHYKIKSKKDLLEHIVGYVMDSVDDELEFDFVIKKAKKDNDDFWLD